MPNASSDRFFHPWHSLPLGSNAPVHINAIIEIPQGSKAKYELDKETGFLRLDRILASNLTYPFHYGFIPQTYCADNDPLDILVHCSEPLIPLSIVESRVIGALKMLDDGQQDDKIIAVAAHDPYLKAIKNINDLDQQIVSNIQHFFSEYKKPENKQVIIQQILNKEEALKIVAESIDFYIKNYKLKIDLINF